MPARRPFGPILRAGGVAGLWAILALPPLHLVIGGRGGDVFALELLGMLAALLVLWRQGFRVRSCASLSALALYLAASAPAAFNATDLPRHVYGLIQFGFAGLMLYAITAPRLRPALIDDLIRWVPVPFVLLALIVLVSIASHDLLATAGARKVETSYGGSNFLASMLLLGAYVPLGVAIGGGRRGDRLPSLIAFGVIMAAIVATGSRTALAMAPVGGLITVLVLARHGQLRRSRVLAVAGVAVVVLVLLGPFLISMVEAGRFRDPFTQRNFLARLELFDIYRRQFLTHPWLGNGHLNGRASPALALLGEGGAAGQAASWGAHVQAHNWVLQCLTDSGVIGGAAFLVFLGASWRTVVAGARPSHPWLPASAGMLGGFVAVVVHGLLEPNFHGKPFIYLFVLLLGLAEQIRRVHAHPADLRPKGLALAQPYVMR